MEGYEGFWVYEKQGRNIVAKCTHWDDGAYHYSV